MPRTNYTLGSRPDFLVDTSSAERSAGRQILWASVDASFNDANGRALIPHGQPMCQSGIYVIPCGTGYGTESAAIGLLEGPAHEDDESAALTGYGLITGGLVYEELIPNLSATVKTALAALARGFRFEAYVDTAGDWVEES